MKQTIYNSKKAEFNLNDIPGIAMSFLVVALTLTLLLVVNKSFQDSSPNNFVNFRNDTLTWAGNNTAIKLTNQDVVSVFLYNNGTLVNQGSTNGTGNYTVSSSDGRITILNQTNGMNQTPRLEYITNALNVSYDYSIGSYAKNISGYGLTAGNTLSSYLPTVALVAIAAVIVGVVLMMFNRKKE